MISEVEFKKHPYDLQDFQEVWDKYKRVKALKVPEGIIYTFYEAVCPPGRHIPVAAPRSSVFVSFSA